MGIASVLIALAALVGVRLTSFSKKVKNKDR